MRNRGVEIYISPGETVNSVSKLDLASLLVDAGINDILTQKALIKLDLESNSSNLSTLLSNGFWTAQYIKQGWKKSSAFEKSSKRIYKFLTSDNMHLLNEVPLNHRGNKIFDVLLARPSLILYITHPEIARGRQSFALFWAAILLKKKRYNPIDVPMDYLGYFFDGNAENENAAMQNLITLNILHIFLTSAEKNIKLISHYIKLLVTAVDDTNCRALIQDFSQKLENILPKSDLKQFPWDHRWFLNIERFYGHRSKIHANNVMLHMKYVYKSLEKNCSLEEGLTIEQYSKNLRLGNYIFFFLF